jgi:AcrR family transcriptional regulator
MAPNAPLQARSQETHDRLLDAAERLLDDHPWTTISVQRLAREAGFTSGALYGRFGGKADVLTLLLERLRDRIERSLVELEGAAADRSGPAVLDLLAEHLFALYRRGGSLLRSLREAARDDAALRDTLVALNREIHERLGRLLAEAYEMPLEDPRPGVALLLLIPPVREILVERSYWPAVSVEGSLAEIRRAVGAYLELAR